MFKDCRRILVIRHPIDYKGIEGFKERLTGLADEYRVIMLGDKSYHKIEFEIVK